MPVRPRGKALVQKKFGTDLICYALTEDQPPSGLALVQCGETVCLFLCDAQWGIVNDICCDSVAEAKRWAEAEAGGMRLTWQTVS